MNIIIVSLWTNILSCHCSVAKSLPTLCDPHRLQHANLLCPPLSPGTCSNSCALSQECYLTISVSATTFSVCPQSFPASGPFPVSQLFTSGGQSVGALVSVSIRASEWQNQVVDPGGLTSELLHYTSLKTIDSHRTKIQTVLELTCSPAMGSPLCTSSSSLALCLSAHA